MAENRAKSKIPLPMMMDWTKWSEASDFFVNTPSLFSVYMSQLMCEHMLKMGGLDYYENLADLKSKALYDFLDKSCTNEKIQFSNKVDK